MGKICTNHVSMGLIFRVYKYSYSQTHQETKGEKSNQQN